MFNNFFKSFKKEEKSLAEMHNEKMEMYANQFSGFNLNLNEVKSSSSDTRSDAYSNDAWNNFNLDNIAISSLDESSNNLYGYDMVDFPNYNLDTESEFEFEDYSIYEDIF